MPRVNHSADKIITACMNLLCSKGYSGMSVSDISHEAGVSRITFYRNFSSKEDVIERFVDTVARKVEAAVAKLQDSGNIRSYFEVMFTEIAPYSQAIKELYAVNMGEIILQVFNRYFFQTPVRNDGIRLSYYESKFFIGAFYNVLIAWILTDQQETPEEMADLCSHMVNQRGAINE